MYNLYRGNSGKARRIEDSSSPQHRHSPPPAAMPQPGTAANPLSRLTDFLPKVIGELETEDILLMLILYLMYRESGDSELLMIMGAMFLV